MTLQLFGDPLDEGAVKQIENVMRDERAVAGALMADHHLGYSMPIGGVVAYRDAISPSGVGFDIGCGNKAAQTSLFMADIHADVPALMETIQGRVAFGLGRRNKEKVDHELFDSPVWGEFPTELKEKAREQLGTVGSGNHYVDLLVDENGYVWVACHFGSRGFGHTVASGFLAIAAGKDFGDRVKESEEPAVLDIGTPAGDMYVEAMRLAGQYAYAGRDYIVDQVLDVLGATATFSVHNHHNYAWKEDDLWVVRKGATPLTLDEAFIGGSMGDVSVIVRGKGDRGNPHENDDHIYDVEDIGALGSAPHGAGRVMSRTKAAGKFRKVKEMRVRPDGSAYEFKRRVREGGVIDWPTVKQDLRTRGITVLGAGPDEAPGVYKGLEAVLAHHPNAEIIHRLQPVGVVMAGDDVFDPYKD
jgi:tRNA-splicing ligase RtcB